MVRKSLLVLLCAVAALGLCVRALQADDKSTPGKDIQKIVGTWKHIGFLDTDGKVKPVEGFHHIKLVTPTHFIWFDVDPKTKRAVVGLSGRCSLKGTAYTEFIDVYGRTAEDVQQPQPTQTADDGAFTAKCRLAGDRWYHEFPHSAGDPAYIEVWERLKPGQKMF